MDQKVWAGRDGLEDALRDKDEELVSDGSGWLRDGIAPIPDPIADLNRCCSQARTHFDSAQTVEALNMFMLLLAQFLASGR